MSGSLPSTRRELRRAQDLGEDIARRAPSQGDARPLDGALDALINALDGDLAIVVRGAARGERQFFARQSGGRDADSRREVTRHADRQALLERVLSAHSPFAEAGEATDGARRHALRWRVGTPLELLGCPGALLVEGVIVGRRATRALAPAALDDVARDAVTVAWSRDPRAALTAVDPDAAVATLADDPPAATPSTTPSAGAPTPTPSLSPRLPAPCDIGRDRIDPLAAAAAGTASDEALAALFPETIGRSAALLAVLETVARVADSEIPVLIEGESGTGKELIARAVHRLSARAERPFVSENCGAIPGPLAEAEIFGHEKGAFTGASQSRPGLLERADGGTLFLDEIGEMDMSMQKKLLRVLQERHVRRVGGDSSRPVDIRVISATNRNLESMVRERLFRDDLFYRLHVVCVRLPALRERSEDISLLVEHFARQYAHRLSRDPLQFRHEAMARLAAYWWPGNIRELGNEVWRLASTLRDEVRVDDLATRITRSSKAPARDSRTWKTLYEIEREALGSAILDVLHSTQGNLARASRILGIGRATLYRRMDRYGIHFP